MQTDPLINIPYVVVLLQGLKFIAILRIQIWAFSLEFGQAFHGFKQ